MSFSKSHSYEAVIGLEVHCQLKTRTKLFCDDPNLYGERANSHAGPYTLALPGTLPVLNQEVARMAVMAALALNCKIAKLSKFDRKHYFYPDLPKGYQISQYDQPYATKGFLEFFTSQEAKRKVEIHRIHIEEDAGKLIHASPAGDRQKSQSYVDLNRAGTPLLEIVTEPDLRGAQEASDFLQTLQAILRAIDVTDGNMEEGSLRCDANVSVRKGPEAPLGIRKEIKNLNSYKALRSAINYEIEEQTAALGRGEELSQSTLLWDADRRKTILMRKKEDAEDYRYFPEPDLLPLVLEEEWIEDIRRQMPELPAERRQRYMRELQLSGYDAGVLVRQKELADYFEQVYAICKDAKKSANWVKDEVLGLINKDQSSIQNFPCTAQRLGRLIALLNDAKITSPMAKQIFAHIYQEDLEPEEVITKYNYKTLSLLDIQAIIEEVFLENEANVKKILDGNERVKGHLIGQVMKKAKAQAPPQDLRRLIDEKLGQLSS